MLSLGKIAAGPLAARYYTDQVASGREDYYSGEGEAPGRWTGSAAATVGLTGRVEAGQLEELLAGAGLRRPAREGAVAGFDLTFRAPKSVGILWGIGDPAMAQALGDAHDAAVDAALGYLEREACWGRRGTGGVVQVRGGGLIAAAFRHRASRDGDPLLHTHVVAGNLTQGPDDRWTALDARHLYRHAKTAGFLYQAQLRREVTERLGLSWEAVEKGTADIEGVGREAIEHFSQRRARILEHMKAHGGRSAASAQVAALETRRAKRDVDVDRLREQWRSRAAEHGLDRRQLARLTQEGYRGVPIAQDVAPDDLTADASTFGRPELLQALAEAQPRGARIEDLERIADRMLGYRQVVALPRGPAPAGLAEPRFTTQEMLATEQDLLDRATGSVGAGRAVAPARAINAAFDKRALSPEQQTVVRDLCVRGDGIAVLRAPAGTGKTHVLDAAREAWAAGRVEVVGCALSARAALELHDQAAIPSVTIAQLKGRLDDGTCLPRAGVLVVDEAGMVGTRDLARLAHAAEQAQAKLVLVGDDRQLPEIQAGGAFHALAERLPTSELREVRRQRHDWDRQALDALRSGEVEQWARAYRDRGQITVGDSSSATRAALVNDWSRADGDRLMIAARRDDVRELNDQARRVLQHDGRVGPDELTAAGRGYATGDRIIGTRNDRRAGILNGQRGTVKAAHPETASLDVTLDDGTQVHLGPDYLAAGHLDHGYAITAHRAQGATVDRTFVLGGEELYRQWGYTAMSRHREQARFYVARTDLHDDRDLPPTSDPLIAGIGRLIDRSRAKELALDSLPQADREALELERRQLREQLGEDPPPRRLEHIEQHRLGGDTRALENAREREHLLRESGAQLKWHQRAARAANQEHLERNLEEQSRWTMQAEQTAGTRAAGDAADRRWVSAHGPEALRLLAVDEELHTRDHLDYRADRRLQGLGRNPLDPGLPGRDLDSGLDLGL